MPNAVTAVNRALPSVMAQMLAKSYCNITVGGTLADVPPILSVLLETDSERFSQRF